MKETTLDTALERRFTEKETAELLGVSKMTVRRKREAGELRFYKIGSRIIISESQIAQFLEGSEWNKSDGGALRQK